MGNAGVTVLLDVCRVKRAGTPRAVLNGAHCEVANPDLVEHGAVSNGLSARNLRTLVIIATALVAVIFSAYCIRWVVAHAGFLFDPRLQNDDARTALFPFHRYGINPSLANDPIAREMMSYVTPGLWALYRVLVPVTSLFVASKIVQALALGVLVLAGVLLARSPRGGLGPGLLLIFLVLSDAYAVGRISGGHARAFAFPCFALWCAGVIVRKRWARIAAPLIGALFYPAVMLMLVAAEAFYVIRRFWNLKPAIILRRVRRASLMGITCLLLSLPSVIGGDSSRGPIHTLEQAKKDPAFYGSGRLWVLPLGDPKHELTDAFLTRFGGSGRRLFGGAASLPTSLSFGIALGIGVVCFVLSRQRRLALSGSVLAFTLGAIALYFAARMLAFRLYSTERYYGYCMRMASCLFLVAATAGFVHSNSAIRRTVRSATAALFMLGQWLWLGDGIVGNNGMTIDSRWDADLYAFIRSLPAEARFASHPMDGDAVPYFGARATTGTFETLQPWFVNSWQRQKAREFATLDMLYARSLEPVLSYCDRYSVTHVLLNRDRYDAQVMEHARSFEPFSAYTDALLRSRDRTSLALAALPEQAVVFDRRPWVILDVTRLRHVHEAGPTQAPAPNR